MDKILVKKYYNRYNINYYCDKYMTKASILCIARERERERNTTHTHTCMRACAYTHTHTHTCSQTHRLLYIIFKNMYRVCEALYEFTTFRAK